MLRYINLVSLFAYILYHTLHANLLGNSIALTITYILQPFST